MLPWARPWLGHLLRVALRASPAPPAPPGPAGGQVQPPQGRAVGWEEKGGARPLKPRTLGPSPAVPRPPPLGTPGPRARAVLSQGPRICPRRRCTVQGGTGVSALWSPSHSPGDEDLRALAVQPSCLVLGGIVDPRPVRSNCAAWLVGGDCSEQEAGTGSGAGRDRDAQGGPCLAWAAGWGQVGSDQRWGRPPPRYHSLRQSAGGQGE